MEHIIINPTEKDKENAKTIRKERLCDCGCYTMYPMATSNGTSCPDCYDDMSD